ncbi:DNA internalization-related competence protein ComEC/Rec2 [Steroidobacter agaridevorans]|uniref:DNA internalization-related competence protein ComEC/Rec2 n=1 Tax=Steroidobacter agaridevorans TaxID=2695856 RepID=UPI001326404E|nr:DNA internalization-related competence protein ComEC/Rec2 [Steroidobacter agaridevorans]GFE87919.1 DNA internalization-related competence protein ComEC/Rec2 [Steroidobacter agaridevorans]
MGAIALGFLAGHCLIHGLPHLPAPAWLVVIVLALLMLLVGRHRAARKARDFSIATASIAVLLGILWAWGHAASRLAEDLPPALEGRDVIVRGFIASLPDSKVDPQFEFDGVDAAAGIPKRLRLTWYRAPSTPQPGEQWQLTVRLKRRNGFANPGGFDYEGYLFREGFGAVGYVRDDDGNRRLQGVTHRYAIARARAWIGSRIATAVGDHPMLGVLQGLAIGDTSAMQVEQWRVFAATGTTHLMAISGLHIGMVAMLAAWAGGRIVRWRRAQPLGLTAMHGQVLAGLAAATIYSVLAGLSVPTQRTLVMLCIYFGLRWWRRPLAIGRSLSLALIVILLLEPFATLAVGAWLSFVAVLVILMATSGRLLREGTIASFSRVQWAVTIGLIPVLLLSFGNLSLVAPVANVLAIPAFTLLIVPGVLVGTLAATIHPSLGAPLFKLPLFLLDAGWPVLEWLARQPLAVWHAPQPSLAVFVALVVGVLLLTLPAIWPLRLTGALLCLPMMFYRAPTPAPGTFELTVLDVGQGLAAVVRTHSRTLVYDTGPSYQSGRSAAELAVLPFLRYRGVRSIDLLMVSHGDQDHSGGMSDLLAGLPVRAVAVGPSVTKAPLSSTGCERGQQWQWDGVWFTVLHPEGPSGEQTFPESGNDGSCVLLIRGRAGSALLTGDIEAEAEHQLLKRGLPRATVVVAPHHGSDTSSSSLFVAAVRPDVTIFSTGYRNRWNFPRPAVVARWQEAGARCYDTGASGAISVVLEPQMDAANVQVREQRHTQRRYWAR